MLRRQSWLLVLCVTTAAACGEAATERTPLSPGEPQLDVSDAGLRRRTEMLGGRIFNDRNLSLNRNQSCSSCHDPDWGFTAPVPAVNAGGAVMPGSNPQLFGNRRPPSAAYATQAPIRFFDDNDGTFVGGNFWDGRATGARLGSPAAEQALNPFISRVEQGLPDLACVLFRVRESTYAGLYRSVYGPRLFDLRFPDNTPEVCAQPVGTVALNPENRARAIAEYDNIGRAIATFEGSAEVNEFSSKHDAVMDGVATFTAEEARGFALFAGKAQCSACHPNDGRDALFTDFTYDNIGVPANPLNPALLANPAFLDLGIGGAIGDASFHGAQKVPTLRNLDKRGVPGGAKSFMHNGVLKSLEQVVRFYNTRDVLPVCNSIPTPRFGENCWPAPEVAANVNQTELGNLGLSPHEERALVAYLRTLSDGVYRPRRAP
jgi:cytochrome c peroxidase